MNHKSKLVLSILIFIGFIAGASFLYSALKDKVSESNIQGKNKVAEVSDAPGKSSESKKNKAADFTVIDKDGNSVQLSDFLGTPVVVNFWASWCPPCKSEMPEFNEVYQDIGEKVKFMMVDMTDGSRETVEKASSFVKEQGYTFPVYFDTEQTAAYTYQVYSIPTTVFIDKDGYLINSVNGAMSKDILLQNIEKLMPDTVK